MEPTPGLLSKHVDDHLPRRASNAVSTDCHKSVYIHRCIGAVGVILSNDNRAVLINARLDLQTEFCYFLTKGAIYLV